MKLKEIGSPDSRRLVAAEASTGTEAIAGEGKIVTAGGIDCHIHFICPQQIEHALMSGVTSMLGGGTGPSHGTYATTCTPGPWHMGRMIQSFDAFPVNLGISGKGDLAYTQLEPLLYLKMLAVSSIIFILSVLGWVYQEIYGRPFTPPA